MPVTVLAPPAAAPAARAALASLAPRASLMALPMDDAWVRDTLPVYVSAADGGPQPLAVVFGFNAWGGLYSDFHNDAELARRVAELSGAPFVDARQSLVTEGGALATDGEGTLWASRTSMLRPPRHSHPATAAGPRISLSTSTST